MAVIDEEKVQAAEPEKTATGTADNLDVDDVDDEYENMPELEKHEGEIEEDLEEEFFSKEEFQKDCGVTLLQKLLAKSENEKKLAVDNEKYERAKQLTEQITEIEKHLEDAKKKNERSKALAGLARRPGVGGMVDMLNPMRTIRLLQASGFSGFAQIGICILLFASVLFLEYCILSFVAPDFKAKLFGGSLMKTAAKKAAETVSGHALDSSEL